MKTANFCTLVALILFLGISRQVRAQWTQSPTALWTSNVGQKVGIGTNAPQQKLDVNGDAKMNQLFLYKDFNGSDGGLTITGDRPTIRLNGSATNQKWLIHVGTNQNGAFELFNSTNSYWGNPKFSVAPGTGDVRMGQLLINKNWDGAGGSPCITLTSDKPSIQFNSGQNNNKWLMHVGSDFGGAFELYSNAGPVPAFVLTPGTNGSGSMGIGTLKLPAGYKLAVGGRIICEELKVQLQYAWPDYVFAPGYRLKTLEEVAQHIAENGHLPNIPAACEVEEQGISVGEMQTKMMEKIEELTLYLIEMKKENTALKQRVEQLENKH